ncbi:WD40-repeat-containing domain protein, partial [Suillus americanus]
MRAHKSSVWVVASFKDGRRVVTGSDDKTLCINDSLFGLWKKEGHSSGTNSITVSPGDRRIATSGSCDHTIRTNLKANCSSSRFDDAAQQDWVQSVMWSPDSQQLVSASLDTTFKFWNSLSGYQIIQLITEIGHTLKQTTWAPCVAISPNGELLVSEDREEKVRLW